MTMPLQSVSQECTVNVVCDLLNRCDLDPIPVEPTSGNPRETQIRPGDPVRILEGPSEHPGWVRVALRTQKVLDKNKRQLVPYEGYVQERCIDLRPPYEKHARYPVPLAQEKMEDFVATVEKYTNMPYVWGGRHYVGDDMSGPSASAYGCDCSGLAYNVYQHLGYEIPRNASDQYWASDRLISPTERRIGDLIFKIWVQPLEGGTWVEQVQHVMLYLGRDEKLGEERICETTTMSRMVCVSLMNQWLKDRLCAGSEPDTSGMLYICARLRALPKATNDSM